MPRITGASPTVATSTTCGWRRLSSRRAGTAWGIAVAGSATPCRFRSAFGRDRFLDGARSARGTLDCGQLLEGAGRLLGPWFPGAYGDDERRGWGIAFESSGERAAYDPEVRLRLARLGASTPPEAAGREQTWHTYPPVEMPSSDRVIAALSRPETWPDYASSLGRFTPLRRGGLLGQTFEIEVVAGAAPGRPIVTRGYVTITTLVSREDPEALRRYIDELNDGLARFGRDEPPAVGEGAEPVLAFDLTTHEGHFIGRSKNRLVFEEHGRTYVRAARSWIRCRGTSTRPIGAPGATPSTRSGGRAPISKRACSTRSPCGSAEQPRDERGDRRRQRAERARRGDHPGRNGTSSHGARTPDTWAARSRPPS